MTLIKGHVTDSQGRAVAQAAVYVVSAPVSMPDIAQLTNDEGRFTLAAPVPGRFRVGIRSSAGATVETEVNVGTEESIDIEVHLSG